MELVLCHHINDAIWLGRGYANAFLLYGNFGTIQPLVGLYMFDFRYDNFELKSLNIATLECYLFI